MNDENEFVGRARDLHLGLIKPETCNIGVVDHTHSIPDPKSCFERDAVLCTLDKKIRPTFMIKSTSGKTAITQN